MVLEATILVLDNSEWMRNGDYTPTRLEAQNDAVNLIFSAKTQSNPENEVGLMTMAGNMPRVMVTLTNTLGQILTAVHDIKLNGQSNLATGLQIAQLALKHRKNKNQKQRIVVFCGSPIFEDEKVLVKIGKKLKKNNVAVDVVNFGENQGNTSEDGPPVGFAAGSGSGGAGFEFGIDPNLDPELALALRMSLDEERARQEPATDDKSKELPKSDTSTNKPAAVTEVKSSNPASAAVIGSTDEEEELTRALAMSLGASAEQDVEMEDLTEAQEIERAIQMSINQNTSPKKDDTKRDKSPSKK